MGRRLELVVTIGPLLGRRFVVTEAGLRLGRSSSNDIHIPDEELSRSHCLFEPVGDTGVRLTDLASANGTFLNGSQIAHEPVVLKHGDRIGVGGSRLRVEDPDACDEVFEAEAPELRPSARRARGLVLGVLVLVALAGALAYTALHRMRPRAAPAESEPVLRDAAYERVDANARAIRRVYVTLTPDGVLSLSVKCVPGSASGCNRHVPLDSETRQRINRILSWKNLKDIDREYAGPDPEPPALVSRTLKVVYDNHQRTIRVTNAALPGAFQTLCDELETFVSAALGQPLGTDARAPKAEGEGGAS